MSKANSGFTLIEVLVAVVILAISLTALLQSTQSNISNTNYLLDKNIATWLAEDINQEIQLGLLPTNPSHDPNKQLQRKSLNRDWLVEIHFTGTTVEKLYKLSITVKRGNKVFASVEDDYYAA